MAGAKYHKKIIRALTWVAFVFYLAVLIYYLFFSDGFNRTMFSGEYRINLKPFYEIKRSWKLFFQDTHKYFHYFMINFVMNIVAFVPFGFMMPIIRPARKSFWWVLFYSLLLTVTVELMQLFLKAGTCDVDDILLNVCGGVAGYLFYVMGYAVYRRLFFGKAAGKK